MRARGVGFSPWTSWCSEHELRPFEGIALAKPGPMDERGRFAVLGPRNRCGFHPSAVGITALPTFRPLRLLYQTVPQAMSSRRVTRQPPVAPIPRIRADA